MRYCTEYQRTFLLGSSSEGSGVAHAPKDLAKGGAITLTPYSSQLHICFAVEQS